MQSRSRIWTFLFVGFFLLAFAYASYYLYSKQQRDFNILSFQVEQAERQILVNDVDRLFSKLDQHQVEVATFFPESIFDGMLELASHDSVSFNSEICSRVFLSANAENFVLTLDNAELSAERIVNVLQDKYEVDVSLSAGKIKIGSQEYQVDEKGNFLVISHKPYQVTDELRSIPAGNPDFIFIQSDSSAINHMLTKDYHFMVTTGSGAKHKSRPVEHRELFEKIPSEFDQITFYGGSRFQEDVDDLFQEYDSELFSWMDNGMLLIKAKDSLEIMIGRQNNERDLRMILEEQTLAQQGDSAQLNSFNIGSFDVLYFETEQGWKKSVPELDSELKYYSEYDNFNVLASSLSAMRWFLAEFQQDRFFLRNEDLAEFYTDAIPEKLNYLLIDKAEQGFSIYSSVNTVPGERVSSEVHVGGSGSISAGSELELLADIPVEIVPSRIQTFEQSETNMYLLNNRTQVAMYMENGTQVWRLDLSTPLNQAPQLIDFENDGLKEFVLFQGDQMDVVGSHGKSKPGFPIKLSKGSNGGIALNYDNEHNYRLLVSNGKDLLCYNESGKTVMGWMFKGMTASLDGPIEYNQVAGKDYICFSDKSGKYYRLNRRGESRFTSDPVKRFKSEADFILGSGESNLRKPAYKNQHIYSYYLKDGSRDSSKIDLIISPKQIFWRQKSGQIKMIVEEANRTLTFDEFGYKNSEIIKESPSQEILNVFGSQDFSYLFFDSQQNKLYLRDAYGQLLTDKPVRGSRSATLTKDRLITFVGNKIKVYKLN